ncbi:trypsin 3A1-like [Periplaneta americana]|uniref:trypsin 3A1-like n=1 Tax=Periplaneta americana TaxID=6978 RepID=UPI0037E75578
MKQCIILLLTLCIHPDFSLVAAQNPIEPRVVGGRNATKKEFPFVVAMVIDKRLHCTGTIIDNLHILTSARCLEDSESKQWFVKAGFYIWDDPKALTKCVKTITIHPKFINNGVYNWKFDIGIARLYKPYTFTACIQPVTLPNPGQRLAFGTRATFIGWGMTKFLPRIEYASVLQAMDVIPIKKSQCKEAWTKLNRTICAIGTTPNKDSCYLDTGAPMMVGKVQWGLLTRGTLYCTGKRPMKFLDVSRYRKWIDSIVKE